jgi:hypothetical protein
MSLFAKPSLPVLPPLPPKAYTIRLSACYHKDEAAAQAAADAAAVADRHVDDDHAVQELAIEQEFGVHVEAEVEDEDDWSSKPLARVDLSHAWRTTSQLLWDVDVPIPYSVQRTASMIIDKLSTSEQFLLKIAACVCVGVGQGCVHFTEACVRACHPFPPHVEILEQGMNLVFCLHLSFVLREKKFCFAFCFVCVSFSILFDPLFVSCCCFVLLMIFESCCFLLIRFGAIVRRAADSSRAF